jgi:DEAD/DEAH box helicase domain-containing protein
VIAVGNLLKTIGALLLMCDVRDLSLAITENIAGTQAAWEPNLFLYDNYPSGIGHSQPLFTMRDRLLQGALQLVQSCPCEAGCPSCVGPLGEVGEKGKQLAIQMLDLLACPENAERTNADSLSEFSSAVGSTSA